VAYFVSALDSLRLYAILSRVSTENAEAGGNQDHRGMRRQGGLGRSTAPESGVQPILRRPQDGTQIERAFSRKNAQNSQNGNPFLSLVRLFPGIRNPQSAIA
jgi:hypothetical protein